VNYFSAKNYDIIVGHRKVIIEDFILYYKTFGFFMGFIESEKDYHYDFRIIFVVGQNNRCVYQLYLKKKVFIYSVKFSFLEFIQNLYRFR